MKKDILIVASLLLAFTSCYNEDNLNVKLGTNDVTLQDSKDSLDHYIYNFYKDYGTYIYYKYDTLDYRWNFSTMRNTITMTQQDDKVILMKGVKLLEKVFFNLYDDQFKKTYFPFKILLAKKIYNIGSWKSSVLKSDYSTSFIALGNIDENIDNMLYADIQDIKNSINFSFWLGYMISNEKLQIPEEFYNVSHDYYKQNLRLLVSTSDIDPDPALVDPHKFGFLYGYSGSYRSVYKSGKYYWAPFEEIDLEDFFELIFNNTKSEIDEIMKDSPKLQDKYNILISYVKEKLNFDLQSIAGY